MATFFGEILPISSRNVDVDEDEEDEYQAPNLLQPFLLWSKKVSEELTKAVEKRILCEKFVIAFGEEGNAFTEVYVKTSEYEVIGGIFIETEMTIDDPDTLLQTSTDKACLIYRCYSKPNILICQCNRKISPEYSFEWAKLICSNINLDTAYTAVLTTCSTGTYSSDIPSSELETPFLRALKTDKLVATPVCQILEQPNMITGLPAQLLTFFQVLNYQAVMYVVYKESRYAEISTVKAFLPLLDVASFKDITRPYEKSGTPQMLKNIIEKHQDHDTMYL